MTSTETDPVEKAKATFVRSEPVLAAHGAAAIVGYVLAFLVTHGVITGTQSSQLTQTFVPIVTAALIALLGILVRRVVSPAALFTERVEKRVREEMTALVNGPTIKVSSRPTSYRGGYASPPEPVTSLPAVPSGPAPGATSTLTPYTAADAIAALATPSGAHAASSG